MGTESAWTESGASPVEIAAAEWLVRLQDPNLSIEETFAWQAWLSVDPKHAESFARLEEISLAASKLRDRIPPPRTTDSVHRHSPDWLRMGRALAASLLIALAVAVTALVSTRNSIREAPALALSTAVGQNRTFVLEDGSQVTLGGSSQVRVTMSKQFRDLELQHGEAYFVVAKDRSRPFRVNAGDARVTAVGTQFDIRRQDDREVVVVTEGRVLLEPAAPHIVPLSILQTFDPMLRPIRLPAGERAMAGTAGIGPPVKIADSTAVTSWQRGRLAFRLEPLKYVVQDVNRYSAKRIVLADDDIGSLLITGTLSVDNIPGWIESLRQAFNLESVEEGGHILLRRR